MIPPAPTLNMAEACALLGISTDTGYSLVRRNEFPAPVLRLGRTIRIPRAPLLALLGLTDDPPEGTQPAGRRDGTGPGRIKCDPYDYSFTAENIAIGLIEPMYPVTTPEPSSTFSLDLSLGERTQVHGWPPVPDVYEAEVADRVRQQQARNRLASIREIAAARNARLGLHDDPSDDAEDDGEIVQKAAIRALTDAGRRMVIDPGAVPCALVEWEDKRVDL